MNQKKECENWKVIICPLLVHKALGIVVLTDFNDSLFQLFTNVYNNKIRCQFYL